MINQLKLIGLPFAISSFLYVAPNSVGCPADAFEGDDNEYVTPGKPPAEASGMESEPPHTSPHLNSLELNEEGGNGGNPPVSDQTTDLHQVGGSKDQVTTIPQLEDGGDYTVTTMAVREEGGEPTSEVGGEEGGGEFDAPKTTQAPWEEG